MKSRVVALYTGFLSKLYVRLRFIICPFEKVEKYVPKTGTLIDVGCGFGLFAFYLKFTAPARNVIGCDLDSSRIARANAIRKQKKINGIHFFVKDVKNLTLGNVRAVTMVDLLHHVPYPIQKKLIREIAQKLSPRGKLIIKDLDDKPRWKHYWNFAHDAVMTRTTKLYFIPSRKLVPLLESCGFTVKVHDLRSTLIPYNHVLYVAQK